jgi:hypothetical protein
MKNAAGGYSLLLHRSKAKYPYLVPLFIQCIITCHFLSAGLQWQCSSVTRSAELRQETTNLTAAVTQNADRSSRTAPRRRVKSPQILSQSRNTLHFTELKCSLPPSQNIAIYLHPKPHHYSPQNPAPFFRSTFILSSHLLSVHPSGHLSISVLSHSWHTIWADSL